MRMNPELQGVSELQDKVHQLSPSAGAQARLPEEPQLPPSEAPQAEVCPPEAVMLTSSPPKLIQVQSLRLFQQNL